VNVGMEYNKRGTLHLVVGPSGVGKDSILDGACAVLEGHPDFVFPRRLITRPENAGGEDHIALTELEFIEMERSGGLVLNWRAHGLRYGLPTSIEEDLAEGRNVVVNVSRSIVAEARSRLAPIAVVYVTVGIAVLEHRLRNRGRETEEEISKRLEQAHAYAIPDDADTCVLVNDETLEKSVSTFVALLQSATPTERCLEAAI